VHWIVKYSPIFFDFDGLLADTEPLHHKAYQILLNNHGFSLSWDLSYYTSLAHKSAVALRDAISEQFSQLLREHSWEELYEEKQKIYTTLVKKGGVKLMAGAAEVLKVVSAANIPHAVVTNSILQHVSIVRKQLPQLQKIKHWITREAYCNPKPAPDCYFKAMEVVGKSDNMLGFEDSLRGVQALSRASITPVLISSLLPSQLDLDGVCDLSVYPSFTAIF